MLSSGIRHEVTLCNHADSATKMHFQFYADPSHGWLRVPKQHLYALDIADQISQCSYENGKYAYLEEDSDAAKYIKAIGKLKDQEWMKKHITFHTANSDSVIRNYPRFEA